MGSETFRRRKWRETSGNMMDDVLSAGMEVSRLRVGLDAEQFGVPFVCPEKIPVTVLEPSILTSLPPFGYRVGGAFGSADQDGHLVVADCEHSGSPIHFGECFGHIAFRF